MKKMNRVFLSFQHGFMGLGLVVSHPTEQPVARRNARLLRNALCQQTTLVISPGTQTVGMQGTGNK